MHSAALALLAVGFSASAAMAEDRGFRYAGGRCVDGSGQEGLNPQYLGQCGDLPGMDFSGQDLTGKDLRGAVATGADFRFALLANALLGSASFDDAKRSATGRRRRRSRRRCASSASMSLSVKSPRAAITHGVAC